jgi:hypothetical protein
MTRWVLVVAGAIVVLAVAAVVVFLATFEISPM